MTLHTYRNERDYPFCPGCGHSLILNHLNAAFVKLGLDPHRIALVTDIGCQGLGDQYFAVNAFHGLHGRSLAYATGIKLADPDLKVFVLIGDGGTGHRRRAPAQCRPAQRGHDGARDEQLQLRHDRRRAQRDHPAGRRHGHHAPRATWSGRSTSATRSRSTARATSGAGRPSIASCPT